MLLGHLRCCRPQLVPAPAMYHKESLWSMWYGTYSLQSCLTLDVLTGVSESSSGLSCTVGPGDV